MKTKNLHLKLFAIVLLTLSSSGLVLSACSPSNSEAETTPNATPDLTYPTVTVPPPAESPTPMTDRERRRISIVDGKFHVDGGTKPIWINGVNVAWHRWNDFDSGYDESWWDGHLAELRATARKVLH